MSHVSFDKIYALEETSFIAGTEYTLDFDIFDNLGIPVDLSGANCSWKLCYYGQPEYAVLTKSATIISTSKIRVLLLSEDTQTLNGKFIQQPIILDGNGSTFRPDQGIIYLSPAIQ